MEWEDSGIILGSHNYSDSLIIVSCLTNKYGLRRGSVRNAKNKKQQIYVGNVVTLSWRGRLEEHLGKFEIKSCESVYPFLYNNQKKLLSLLSICELLKSCLTEKEPQKDLYLYLEDFIYLLKFSEKEWLKVVILLEIDILAKLGFGFDVKSCAVSGTTENLEYLSPKTGRVVSKTVGKEYKDKLFKLPKIFIDHEHDPTIEEIVEALKITKYFFEKNLLKLRGMKLPSIRNSLQQTLQNCVTALK
jgi:DNA repair protein RecO (recombination protein O)